MTGAITLTPAMQDYLETILALSESEAAIRVTDIAAKLSIAKASVNQAIKGLKELGLVVQERYGPVELTCQGKDYAMKVRQYHRTLCLFLVEVLEVDRKTAEKDACLMEHVVSPQTMGKLIEYLEKREVIADHGDRKEESGLGAVNMKALSELQVGARGKVARIAAQGAVRRRMLDMGITPGAEVSVKGVAPFGDPMEVLIKGYSLSLRKDEAADVFIEVSAHGN